MNGFSTEVLNYLFIYVLQYNFDILYILYILYNFGSIYASFSQFSSEELLLLHKSKPSMLALCSTRMHVHSRAHTH